MIKNFVQIAMLISLFSCAFDRVTTKYATFKEAEKDNFFEKGWIPKKLVDENVFDIYLQNDIDINTFIFSFGITELPFKFNLESDLQNQKVKLHRINIPDWWNSEIVGHPRMEIKTELGTINVAVNEELNRVYGWGKY